MNLTPPVNRFTIGFTYCLIVSFFISACGWQLRGLSSKALPQAIQLTSVDRLSAFSSTLARVMRDFNIQSTKDAPLKLLIGKEQLQKRTVAVTNIGTAAQYELRMSIPYQFSSNIRTETSAPLLSPEQQLNPEQLLSSELLPKKASAIRLLDFEAGTNLSKTQEEILLLTEMRNEIALFIIQESRRYTNDNRHYTSDNKHYNNNSSHDKSEAFNKQDGNKHDRKSKSKP